MPRITIDSSRLHLEIDPALGAGLADLSLRAADGSLRALLRRTPDHVRWFNDLACYTLAPWSNRIRDGAFTIAGRAHQLRPDWPDGTAIHGLVKDRPWRLLDRAPWSARLEFDSMDHADLGYPFPIRTRVRYELEDEALHARIELTCSGPEPMPAGVGFHPFFPLRLGPGGAPARIFIAKASAARPSGLRGRYRCERVMPVAGPSFDDICQRLDTGAAADELDLDDVFLGSLDGARVEWPGSEVALEVAVSPELGHTVVYTQPERPRAERGYFCLEPVSMVNDGFNLADRAWPDTGVRVLEPGQSLRAAWSLRLVAPTPAT